MAGDILESVEPIDFSASEQRIGNQKSLENGTNSASLRQRFLEKEKVRVSP